MTPILGQAGRLRGYLLEDSTTIKLLSAGGTVLAIYLKNDDITVSPGNSFVGYGNQLMSLLED